MDRGILTGLAAFRWAPWGWMARVVLVTRTELARPWLAVVLRALALSITVGSTAALWAATMCSFTAAPSRPR